MKDGIFSVFFLFLIILKSAEGNAAKQKDCRDIDNRFKSHRNLRQTPGNNHVISGTDKDHDSSRNPEQVQNGFVFCDEKQQISNKN